MARRNTNRTAVDKMEPPENGVAIRMYRQGHGDCFLLAFPRNDGGDPVYVMIDCGYKPGSQITINGRKVTADDVVRDIKAVTKGKLDVLAVTHEHQDHVNALGKFEDFDISTAWFAWTENPKDKDANELRRRHNDQLLGLLGARNQLRGLAGNAAKGAVARLDELLMLELGGEEEMPKVPVQALSMGFGAGSTSDPAKSQNKQAMEKIKKAARRIEYILPHDRIMEVPGVKGVRVFALGPPKKETLLKDEDPQGDASFPGHEIAAGSSLSFFAAATQSTASRSGAPFAVEYGISKDEAFAADRPDIADSRENKAKAKALNEFFRNHYGDGPLVDEGDTVASNAEWRRIDEEWLFAAESFALKLNRGINNTSLVLAFELIDSGKVLLFAADAQNGNWNSWDDGYWIGDGKNATDDGAKITAKDLLGRTVLYKVGHHGSHNATLNGERSSKYPNLGWMGVGTYAREFTAMIPAHRDWALEKAKWNHPLPAIKRALEDKASGRVLQMDTGLPPQPKDVSDSEWRAFEDRTKVTDLYIEYHVSGTF
ncbi:hypothetical protein [Roseibium sp.]|uniref:hypothetical protein n=1 Tax=Roseibium sp. TaxID=1936156 RepID=UPI00391A43AC